MSHMLIPTPTAAQRQGRRRKAAADSLSGAVDRPKSAPGADASPDAVGLVWDLTVHRLYRASAESLSGSDATHWCPTPPSGSRSAAGATMAGVRLAATRHAVKRHPGYVASDGGWQLRRLPAMRPADHGEPAAGSRHIRSQLLNHVL